MLYAKGSNGTRYYLVFMIVIYLVAHVPAGFSNRNKLTYQYMKERPATRTEKSLLVLTETCASRVKDGIVMKNGDIKTVGGLKIEAVPAYNLVHMRSEGVPFHPKGVGNGYVITFGDKRVYVAGDTENTPEMKGLTGIDIAFLPMNLPYTMKPEMVADAVRVFKPKILYPYHYGDTDTSKIVDLLKDMNEIEVRIRKMK